MINKVFRKTIAVSLAGVMTLSMAGCGIPEFLIDDKSPLDDAKEIVEKIASIAEDQLDADGDSDFGIGRVLDNGDDSAEVDDSDEDTWQEAAEEEYGRSEAELAQICYDMKELNAASLEWGNYLSWLSDCALQVEYRNYMNGNGYSNSKVFSELSYEDKEMLIFKMFNYDVDESIKNSYGVFDGADDYIRYINKANADNYFRDAVGISDIDWSSYGFFQYLDDEHVAFSPADGDPWFYFRTATVKENDGYYLVQGPVAYGDNGGTEKFLGYAAYLFEKTPDTACPSKLIYSEMEYDEYRNLAVAAYATSELEPNYKYGKTYYAENVLDGDIATCWTENNGDVGIGESITLDLGGVQEVYGIEVKNGYLASEYLYTVNGKVTRAYITAGDGSAVEMEFYPYSLSTDKDPMPENHYAAAPAYISFAVPIQTDTITFTIVDAVSGRDYSDTCISEIRVY